LHHREFGRTGRIGLNSARAAEGVLNKLTGSGEVASGRRSRTGDAISPLFRSSN
jgi:hypothetical protein